MKYCSNCGHEMQDDELFCGECGTKVEEETIQQVFCPECGTENSEKDSFCQNCGASLAADNQPVDSQKTENQPEENRMPEGQLTENQIPENQPAENRMPEGQKTGNQMSENQSADNQMPKGQPTDIQPTQEPIAEPSHNQAAEADGVMPDGNSRETIIFCSQCGSKNNAEDSFCQNCGALLKEEVAAVPPSENQEAPKKKSKLPLIGGVAVAAAAVIAVAVGIGKSGKPSVNDPSVIYYKDKGLYEYQIKKDDVLELTKKAMSSSDEYLYSVAQLLFGTRKSEDGRYIFYFEKFDEYSGTLYYKDLKKQSEKNDTSVKVDSDVMDYVITDDNKLYYIKGKSNRNLYSYDLNAKEPEKEKIATDIMRYAISEDNKDLIWTNTDYNLYYKSLAEDSEKKKLDSDVTLEDYSDDLKRIYYSKNGNLYCYKDLSEKEKISSDALILNSFNDNTGIFYAKNKKDKVTAYDLVEDDMLDIDKDIKEPDFDDFKKRVATSWGSMYETDYDAYEAAMEKYEAKSERDYIRSQLKTYEPYSLPQSTDIYIYDGKESKELVKDIWNVNNIGKYSDPVYFGYYMEGTQLPTILLSELETIYDIDDILDDYYEEIADKSMKGYIFAYGKALEVEYSPMSEYYGDAENNTIYYITFDDGSDVYGRLNYQELYSMKYTDKGVESPVLLDDDLDETIQFTTYNIEKNGFFYVKDFDEEEGTGTLFSSGNKVDDDVFTFRVIDDTVYYLKDKSEKNSAGTLMKYEGANATAIAEDVTFFSIVGDYAAVLTDYNTRRYEGDLKLYPLNGKGKEKLVDEEVMFIKNAIGNSSIFD